MVIGIVPSFEGPDVIDGDKHRTEITPERPAGAGSASPGKPDDRDIVQRITGNWEQ